jgi:hypothetical protein
VLLAAARARGVRVRVLTRLRRAPLRFLVCALPMAPAPPPASHAACAAATAAPRGGGTTLRELAADVWADWSARTTQLRARSQRCARAHTFAARARNLSSVLD